jgi:hypothetical protein
VLLLALGASGWGSSASPQRRGDVEVTEIESIRQEGEVTFEGYVTVTRSKPIRGLAMRLHFYDSRAALLVILGETITEDIVEEGDEISFLVGGRDQPRAVSYEVIMLDAQGVELRTTRGGPYPLG